MYQIIMIVIVLIMSAIDTSLWFPDKTDLLYLHLADEDAEDVSEFVKDSSGVEEVTELNNIGQTESTVTTNVEVENKTESAQIPNDTQPSITPPTIQEVMSSIPNNVDVTDAVYADIDIDSEEFTNEEIEQPARDMYGGGASKESIQDLLAKLKMTVSQEVNA